MQLEFHQLDRRWEHLRVRHPARQRRLLASLAESGQQTPIVVVAVEGQVDRYVVIDGYKRIAALEQLGRDTVEAVVWPMSEAAAVLLDRSLRLSAGGLESFRSELSQRPLPAAGTILWPEVQKMEASLGRGCGYTAVIQVC